MEGVDPGNFSLWLNTVQTMCVASVRCTKGDVKRCIRCVVKELGSEN